MNRDLSPKAAAFLGQLNGALGALPPSERADIVSEIEGHLMDRQESGGLDAALAAMGAPEAFARTYLADRQLSQALARPNPLALLTAMLDRAARSVLACCASVLAGVLYLFATAFAAIVVLKEITPANVGWWTSPGHFQFGAIYGTHLTGQERLGYWIVPIAAGAAVACYVMATELLKLVGHGLVRRRRSLDQFSI